MTRERGNENGGQKKAKEGSVRASLVSNHSLEASLPTTEPRCGCPMPCPPREGELSGPLLVLSPHLPPALTVGGENRSQELVPPTSAPSVIVFYWCVSPPISSLSPGRNLSLCMAPLDSTLRSTQRRQGFALFISVAITHLSVCAMGQ